MKEKRKSFKIALIGLGTLFIIAIGIISFKVYEDTYSDGPLKPLTNKQKKEDLEFLYKTIVENYPYLEVNKRLNGVDWEAKKAYYLERAERGNFESVLEMMVEDLNNGHMHRADANWLEWYRDYIWMNKESGSWQGSYFDILNHPRVLKRYNLSSYEKYLNNEEKKVYEQTTPNAQVKDIVEGKVASIYIPSFIQYEMMALDKELIKEYLHKIKDYQALVIDIRGNGGGDTSYWHYFLMPQLINKDYEVLFYSFFKDGDVIKNFFKVNGKKYFKIDHLDTASMPMLPKEVLEKFSYYTTTPVKISPDKDSIQFKGNIYLLVDQRVYSSAEALAVFAKESGLATLIGSQTAGDGIGSEPVIFSLPQSGYVFRMPKEMGTTSDGTCNEEHKTIPHYIVDDTSPLENPLKDQCIQQVLRLENLKYLIGNAEE